MGSEMCIRDSSPSDGPCDHFEEEMAPSPPGSPRGYPGQGEEERVTGSGVLPSLVPSAGSPGSQQRPASSPDDWQAHSSPYGGGDSHFGDFVRNPQLPLRDALCAVRNPQCAGRALVRNPHCLRTRTQRLGAVSAIRSPQCRLRTSCPQSNCGQLSAIRNPQLQLRTPVRNPQFKLRTPLAAALGPALCGAQPRLTTIARGRAAVQPAAHAPKRLRLLRGCDRSSATPFEGRPTIGLLAAPHAMQLGGHPCLPSSPPRSGPRRWMM